MIIRHLFFMVTTKNGLRHAGGIGLAALGHALGIGWLGGQLQSAPMRMESLIAVSLGLWLLSTYIVWRQGGRYDAVIAAIAGAYIFLLHVLIYSRLLLQSSRDITVTDEPLNEEGSILTEDEAKDTPRVSDEALSAGENKSMLDP